MTRLLRYVVTFWLASNGALFCIALFFGTMLLRDDQLDSCGPPVKRTLTYVMPGLHLGCETVLTIHNALKKRRGQRVHTEVDIP